MGAAVTVDLNDLVMASRAATAATRAVNSPPIAQARPVSPAGDRWQSLNQFVDLIAPRLSLAERAVWLVLYRHARDGVVDVSSRGLATAAAVDKMTVVRALRVLEAVGLVWPVWKSGRKGSPSKYAMHHRPGECLARVLARSAAR